MTLKYSVDSLEGLDEGIQALYTKGDDGKFTLNIDGAVPKAKLDEFRDGNLKLKEQLEEMQGKYGDVDLDAYQEAMKKQKALDEKKLIDAGKIDELFEQRSQAMREGHVKEIDKLNEQIKTLTGQIGHLTIDSVVQAEAARHGVAATAIDDVMLRAKGTFQIKDGKPVPVDASGNIIYGEGSSDPMSVSDWVKGLSGTAPHLFAQSSGSGGKHNPGGSGGGSTVTRAQFDAMGHAERMKFSKEGGKVSE